MFATVSRMDSRNVTVKLILLLLFLIYFYTITSDHLAYKTVTNVDLIRRRVDMPPMGDAFCVLSYLILNICRECFQRAFRKYSKNDPFWLTATDDADQLGLNLTLNGHPIRILNEPFMADNYKCWPLEYNQSELITDEIFVLNMDNPRLGLAVLNRGLMNQYKVAFPKKAQGFIKPLGIALIAEMYIFKLLPAPYESDCGVYNVSQKYCVLSCVKKLEKELSMEVIESCSEPCRKPDCLNMIPYHHLGVTLIGKYLTAQFGSNHISIMSRAMYPVSLYIQQTIGLIGMFFDFVFLDLKGPMFLIWTRMFRLRGADIRTSKHRTIRRMKRFARSLLRKFAEIIITFGCLAHIGMSTRHYVQYRVSTQAYIGDSFQDYVPKLGVCLKDDMTNVSFAVENVLNVTFFDKFKPKSSEVYFKSGWHCYAISPPEGINYPATGSSLADVQFLNQFRFQISSGFEEDIPRRKPYFDLSIRASLTFNTRITHLISLEHPYSSNCINYNDIGCKSKQDCVDQCNIRTSSTESDQEPEPKEECARKYQSPDCEYTQMDLVNVLDRSPSTFARMKLDRPEKLISIITNPEQSLVDFVTFTVSLLSIWFGFYFMSFVDTIKLIRLNRQTMVTGLKWSTRIILISLFFCHLYSVINDYLTYEIISTVTMGFLKVITLPFMSIIFKLDSVSANSRFNYDQNQLKYFSAKNLSSLFKSPIELIESVSFRNPKDLMEEEGIPWIHLDNITSSFVSSQHLVLTFDLPRNGWKEIKYDGYKSTSLELNARLDFRVNYKGYNKQLVNYPFKAVYFHSNNYHHESVIKGHNFLKSTVSTELSRTNLLKYPYSTNCVNYVDPLTTINKTYFSCVINHHRKKYGKVPFDLTIPDNLSDLRMKLDESILEMCHEMYKSNPDCESVDYIRTFHTRTFRIGQGDVLIQLPVSETSCVYVPKENLFDLIILIADVFALWLGISFSLILSMSINLTKCKDINDFLIGH